MQIFYHFWSTKESRMNFIKRYHNLGFHLTMIQGNEKIENSYKEPFQKWGIKEQRMSFLTNQVDWNNASGVGFMCGHNNIRALDIDDLVFDMHCRQFNDDEARRFYELAKLRFIDKCLNLLGLPKGYEWVEKTPHGYHIIFKCEDVNGMPDSIGYSPNEHFNKKNKLGISFSRIELFWRDHIVLPPSKSCNNLYGGYEFVNTIIPKKEPLTIDVSNIDECLNYFCGNRSFVYGIDGFYNSPFTHAKFFSAIVKEKCIRNSMDFLEEQNDVSRKKVIGFEGLDSNVNWLKECETKQAFNKLGIISFLLDDDVEQALDFFYKSNSFYSSYNIACLQALDKVTGDIVSFEKYLGKAKHIDKYIKESLRLYYLTTHSDGNYYMFFDTETTGLPENYNAPSSDVNNWPRIVQISWTITDKMGNILSERDAVIKPEGFTIPYHSTDVHGITNEFAVKYGQPLSVVLDTFIKDMSSIKCIVGHNIDFDKKVIEAECYRKRIEIDFDRVESICTMEATVDFMEDYLERRKYPKLQELYYALFEEDIENIHNSINDVNATMRCFFELKNREVL